MNELIKVSNEKMMTTKEVAESLGTSRKVILENAKKCLPNKHIENGKPTFWTEKEVDVLIEQLKCNQPNGKTFPNLSVQLKGVKRCERNSAITTLQFAKQLGTGSNVILENARKCLPNKRIENGKTTYWTEAEVTVILDYMKNHDSNNRSVELNSTVANTSTSLTPALKLKKALELAQEAYEEELARLKAENQKVTIERNTLQIELDESKEWTTLQKYFNSKGWETDRNKLAQLSKTLGNLGYERRKIYSVEYERGLWSYRIKDLDEYFLEPEF